MKKKAVKAWPATGLAKILDAAKFLGFSRVTIYRMIKAGELNSVSVRGVARIPWLELHRLARSSGPTKKDVVQSKLTEDLIDQVAELVIKKLIDRGMLRRSMHEISHDP